MTSRARRRAGVRSARVTPPSPPARNHPLASRRARHPFTPYHPPLAFLREFNAPAGGEAGGVDYPKLAATSLRPRPRRDAPPRRREIAPSPSPPFRCPLTLSRGERMSGNLGGGGVNHEFVQKMKSPTNIALFGARYFLANATYA